MDNGQSEWADETINKIVSVYGKEKALEFFLNFLRIDAISKATKERRPQKTYFIWDKKTNLCKIGKSTSPKDRIKQLNVGNGSQLELLLVVEESENEMHERFKEYVVRGEWYKIEGELKKYLFNL